MQLNVGVIFGGKSVEHEVSIISACEIMGYIDPNKYNVVPIYIDKDNTWYTGMHLKDIINYRDIDLVKRYATKVSLVKSNNKYFLQTLGFFKRNLYTVDVILPIGHGTYMEDGTLQGYLSMLGIPYVGSSVSASALGQDKVLLKQILKENDIPTTNYIWFTSKEYEENKKDIIDKIESTFKYPLYVKPATLGSSIGITKVTKTKDLIDAIKEALLFDNKIIIEEAVSNLKEVNVSVLGNSDKYEVSPIEEINSCSDFYSFKEKYVDGYTKTVSKSNRAKPLISKEMMEDIKKYAALTFKAIGASGVVRVDFLIDEKNLKIYVGEINTVPGALAAYLWLESKTSQSELIDDLIKIALYDNDKKNKLTYSFNNNLLEHFDDLKGTKGQKKEKN